MKETYKDIVNNPGSEVKLKCIKGYSGQYQIGPGQFIHYSYKKGDVLPRTQIMLKPENWKIKK